jgi:gamma-glutamyltranspeptidase/glutathione hydrolase
MFDLDSEGIYTPSFGWRQVQGDANRRGVRSMAVPGNVAGLALALERFGTISLAQALQPAIRLAEEGFPLSEELATEIVHEWPLICRFPSTHALLTDNGRPYARGERWRNPTLARTLRRLAEHGADDFYHGQIARDVAADLADVGSHITLDDLAGYAPRVPSTPLSIRYRDTEIHAAPGASGAITALQTLKLLDGFDLGALDPTGADALHLWTEASRLAFADRGQYVADPQFVDLPWGGLLDDGYAAERRALIRPDRTLGTYEPGDPWVYEGRPQPSVAYPPSRPFQSPGTSHVGVVDASRNAVALTDTLVGWSGVALPRTGIIMNNGMMWFDPEPGHADSIAPHKRGLNNMVPAIVLRNGQPLLTVGARGGRKIIGTVAQVISNVVDRGLGPQAAISTPRIDCNEPVTAVDARLPADVRANLEARGHQLRVQAGRVGASAGAILIDPADGHLRGGEEPTGQGIAAGF